MTFVTAPNGVKYYSFVSPEFDGIAHGFFTRKGGVSEGHFTSLNLGGSIGDNPRFVEENKRRVCAALNRDFRSLYEVWQIHSVDIVCTEKPLDLTSTKIKADGIFTSNPDVTLLMRFADCVPIMIFDKTKHVVGIIHAGWKGTVNRIAERAIERISKQYGSSAKDLVAAIGPSIGPDHYEIGDEVVRRIKQNLSDIEDSVLITRNDKVFMDLWEANRLLLKKAGIKKILNDQICTACDTNLWFSHRAERGKTGRFAAMIGLEAD